MKLQLFAACILATCLGVATSCDHKTMPEVEKIPFEITFSGHESPANLTVEITPIDDGMTYYATMDLKEYYFGEGKKADAILQEDIYKTIKLYEATFGYTPEQALEKMCKKGKSTIVRNNLIANTEYTVLVAGVDKTGKTVTNVIFDTFTSGSVSQSSNTFKINVKDIQTNAVTADIEATNNDLYYISCIPKEGYKSDKDYLEEVKGGDLSLYLKKGNTVDFKKEGLLPKTDYYLLVFGYEAGCPTTDITKIEFTTKSDAAFEMSFVFTPTTIEAGFTEITVTATPADARYYADCAPADADEAWVKKYMDEQIQSQISMGIIKDAKGFYKISSLVGEDFITFYDAELGKSYKPFAFGVNLDTGEIITDVTFGQVFKVEK